jgi:hypothetical protein
MSLVHLYSWLFGGFGGRKAAAGDILRPAYSLCAWRMRRRL